MNIKKVTATLQNLIATIDWTLMGFLLLFLNVKLVVKVAAIVLIYIVRPDFKFGFRLKNSRLPVFYCLVILIAIFNWLVSGLLTNINYNIAVVTGIFFWLLCILAIHQVKLSVERTDVAVIHRTIAVFFLINILASVIVYAGIIWETGAINPYKYQGNFQKYFIGTGDYIKGITLDTSTTNAVINAFGVIFFLLRKKNIPALLCMITLLLTGSNITNLLLLFTLLYIFIFQSNKDQKSIIVVCMAFLVVFLVKVSPQNNRYMTTAYEKVFDKHKEDRRSAEKKIPIKERPDSTLSAEERKQKIALLSLDSMYTAMKSKRVTEASPALATTTAIVTDLKQKPVIPQVNIHAPNFQHKNDTTAFQTNLITFIKQDSIEATVAAAKKYRLPGKAIALLQTVEFFKLHPLKIIMGAGMGMFSSKLAFRISALKIAGGYPAKYAFINNDFKNNNLSLYLNYFTEGADVHSVINTPNSATNQLAGEYGLAGLVCFLLFYIGYFFSAAKLTYGFPLLLLMSGLFFFDYWFEQLSVVVLFELLLLIDIKENKKIITVPTP